MIGSAARFLSVPGAQALCFKNRIPFYSYRLPGSREVVFGAQLSGESHLFQGFERHQRGKGFLVTPFSPSSWSFPYFIRADISFTGELTDARAIAALRETVFHASPRECPAPDPSYREYVERAGELLALIKREGLKKVVLSRAITTTGASIETAPRFFERAGVYDHAFRFLFSLPGKGAWTGVSPELFLKYDRDGFRTVALAGTLPVAGTPLPVEWPLKEQEEQRIVDEYVAGVLATFFTRHLEREPPVTTRAGNVYHLCTRFYSDEQLPGSEIDRLIAQLHPTPAVCGIPKKRAMQVIADMEWQERGYYGGLVGPVEHNGAFDLFVNIRSMELFAGAARLRAGGGITSLSNPVEEWEETCRKADTLLNIVKEMEDEKDAR
ncbi:MAG: chorismate-binding protein [Odoribacteraceae bacterium]|jgi:isochorismate synthase|nr:chorismate-binding protein [Odoribacteraceae bacterium]